MDTGTRKFGVAALVAGGCVGAGELGYAVLALLVYTAANVVLKLAGKEPEAVE